MADSVNLLKKILAFSLLILFVFAASDSYGQRKRKGYLKRRSKVASKYRVGSIHFDRNKWYTALSFTVGSNNYLGDIVPSTSGASFDFSFTKPGLGIDYRWRFHQNMFLKGEFNWGRIKGDDFKSADPNDVGGAVFRYTRNLSFRNDIKELGAVVTFDFFSNHGTFLNRRRFTPYILAGVSVVHHNPRGLAPDIDRDGNPLPEAGQWVALEPLGTEGQYSSAYDVPNYSNFLVSFPGGIGIRWLLDKRWDMEAEFRYNYYLSDYLDDVSGNYVDLGALDGKLAQALSDRSIEENAVLSGERRNWDAIGQITGPISYTSTVDGQVYNTLAGYGHDPGLTEGGPGSNVRGLEGNDGVVSFNIRITYILTGSFKRAKFR